MMRLSFAIWKMKINTNVRKFLNHNTFLKFYNGRTKQMNTQDITKYGKKWRVYYVRNFKYFVLFCKLNNVEWV